jgi:hypothetical protein
VIHRKKSPSHQGIIYLLVPEATHSNLSIRQMGGRSLAQDSQNHESDIALLNSGEEEDPSQSAPSSPKLKSPRHKKLSYSCDNLLSTTTTSALDSPRITQPSIKVTADGRREERVSSGSPELEDSDEESDDSECGLEMINLGGRPSANHTSVGVTNPLLDVLEPGKEAEQNAEEVAAEVKRSESGNEISKFGRLKGRIMRTVKSSNFLSKPISPQPTTSGGEDDGDTDAVSSPVPPPEGGSEEEGKGPGAANKSRFKKASSPSLWRKMRRGSGMTPSQTEGDFSKEADARKHCKSRMIFL